MKWWLVPTLVLAARVASAHQSSIKYVEIALDGSHAAISLRFEPGDVTEPMRLPADAKPSVGDAARAPAVASYVAAWLTLSANGSPCAVDAPIARPAADGKLVTVAWNASCPGAPDRADFVRFFAIDRRHVALVRVGDTSTIIAADRPVLALAESSEGAWSLGLRASFDWGHLAFVLALLLVVMLGRDDRARWEVRGMVPTLRTVAIVIAAFAVAHGISLVAAGLGWIVLPSQLVASAIAVSIVYTAAEDVARPDARSRFALAAGFGLVHGLGFASSPAAARSPVGFLVGIELGQLAIVAVALPILYAIASELGAERYRRVLVPVFAGAMCLAGIVWVIERALPT